MKVSRYNFLAVIFLSISIVGFNSCDDECFDESDPLCENYDPCWEKQAADANFMISQKVFRSTMIDNEIVSIPIDTFIGDTVLLGVPIFFDAYTTNADNYQWKVGTDNRTWRESSLYLNFDRNSTELLNRHLPVKLIVDKEAYPNCFAGDDGVDTVQKSIYFVKREDAKYFGVWEGYFNGDNTDKQRIEIYYDNSGGNFFVYFKNLFGVNNDCISETRNTYIGYKEASMFAEMIDWRTCSPGFYHTAAVKMNVVEKPVETISISYTQSKTITNPNTVGVTEESEVTFEGTRVQ
jgi:hypothetical protein